MSSTSEKRLELPVHKASASKALAGTVNNRIADALDEVILHEQGKTKLKSKTYKPSRINVKVIREGLNLSQTEFSNAFGIPVSTLRNWEQGRREPDNVGIAYLCLIATNAAQVREMRQSGNFGA